MGLFKIKKKSSVSMPLNPRNKSGGIISQTYSTGSEESAKSVPSRSPPPNKVRAKGAGGGAGGSALKLPKFRRLDEVQHQELEEEYVPPPNFLLSATCSDLPAKEEDKKPIKVKRLEKFRMLDDFDATGQLSPNFAPSPRHTSSVAKKMKKSKPKKIFARLQTASSAASDSSFQLPKFGKIKLTVPKTIETTCSSSSSDNAYEPPAFKFPASNADSIDDRAFNAIPMGIKDDDESTLASKPVDNDADNEFSQFVFDKSFKMIEKVAAHSSSHGSSIFSMDQVAAVTSVFSPEGRNPGLSTSFMHQGGFEMSAAHIKSGNRSVPRAHSEKTTGLRSTATEVRDLPEEQQSTNDLLAKKSSTKTNTMRGIAGKSAKKIEKMDDMSFFSLIKDEDKAENDPFARESDGIDDTDWVSAGEGFPFGKSTPKQTVDAFGFHVVQAAPSDPFGFDELASRPALNGKPVAPIIVTKRSADETGSLIDTIRSASRKSENKGRDPDGNSSSHGPSPKALEVSKSDGELLPSPHGVPKCDSDSALEYSKAKLRAQSFMSPQRKPPSGVPSNAILASMLFRQTNPEPKVDQPVEEVDDDADSEDGDVLGVPQAVHADDANQSTVSSVTEEASSFYQKSFQGWNQQAHNILNNYYHKARNQQYRSRPNTSYKAPAFKKTGLYSVKEEHMNMFSP